VDVAVNGRKTREFLTIEEQQIVVQKVSEALNLLRHNPADEDKVHAKPRSYDWFYV